MVSLEIILGVNYIRNTIDFYDLNPGKGVHDTVVINYNVQVSAWCISGVETFIIEK